MQSQKSLLFIAFIIISFLAFEAYQLDKFKRTQPTTTQVDNIQNQELDIPKNNQDLFTTNEQTLPNSKNNSISNSAKKEFITIENDVLRLVIDTNGADIISSKLLQVNQQIDNKIPVELLTSKNNKTYIAQSGLQGIDTRDFRPKFSADKQKFSLKEGDNTISVELKSFVDELEIVKRFILKRGSYALNVDYIVYNKSQNPLTTNMWMRIKNSFNNVDEKSMMMPTFNGGAYSSEQSRYEKIDFEDMNQDPNINTKGGWVAVLEHYFVSAWVLDQKNNNRIFTQANQQESSIGAISSAKTIEPNSQNVFSSVFYTGPKYQDQLASLAPNLELVVDYGILWFIAKPLHFLLTFFQSLVINWGLAIILITLVVKLLLYKLTKTQYVSMAKMRLLQPKLTQLKERYGDDKQQMSKAMMELYKTEKVNPLGGCLPILLQMPIFIALYWVLLESVELRHAPFFLWIDDLSSKDPFFILPILMGISMFLMQKMSPTTITDPTQQKVMQFMPVIFTAFFLLFPAGLVLYWLVSNLISIAQQWWINKNIAKTFAKNDKKISKTKDARASK